MRFSVPVRITLTDPPAGVLFCLEDRKHQLSAHVQATGADLAFDLSIELDEAQRVHGPFAMGPPAQRFLYVCSGTCAGQTGTPWTRRAKIQLNTLPPGIVQGASLEARIQGRAGDGGPACATVPLLDGGWKVRHRSHLRPQI